jgi:hypothetical protein
MSRPITPGERTLLESVFGPFTLPYATLEVDELDNPDRDSITPGEMPYMKRSVYQPDYSTAFLETDRAEFIHEMVHVWQYYHGYHKLLQAGWLWLSNLTNYMKSYPYDLSYSANFDSYNMEQQACIIEDWWLITHDRPAQNNHGSLKSVSAYEPFLAQLRSVGAPHEPLVIQPLLHRH